MKAVIFTAAAVTATAAALLSAPAIAQVPAGPLGAIAHFNQQETGNEVVKVIRGDAAGLSSRSGTVEAQIRFNADYDGGDDARRVTGQTVYSGTPTYGADIFANIRAESLEDE